MSIAALGEYVLDILIEVHSTIKENEILEAQISRHDAATKYWVGAGMIAFLAVCVTLGLWLHA